jgi:hypothetical protein
MVEINIIYFQTKSLPNNRCQPLINLLSEGQKEVAKAIHLRLVPNALLSSVH